MDPRYEQIHLFSPVHSCHYWIIVVEVELFGAQAWIKGTVGSSESTGVTLVPLKADIVDRLDSEEGVPVVFIFYNADSIATIKTPVVNVWMMQKCDEK